MNRNNLQLRIIEDLTLFRLKDSCVLVIYMFYFIVLFLSFDETSPKGTEGCWIWGDIEIQLFS